MLPVAATTSFQDGFEGSGSNDKHNVLPLGGDIRGCGSSKIIVPGHDAAAAVCFAASTRVHVLTR